MQISNLPQAQQDKVVAAIRQAQKTIEWKPGKGKVHLETRKRYGHLAQDTSQADYHAIISTIISSEQAQLYIYTWRKALYPTIVAKHDGTIWLVMVSISGILETAFPPTDPDEYLADSRFLDGGMLMEWLKK